MAAAADPVGTVLVVAGHDDPVPALHVRPGGSQHGKRPIVERIRPDHVAEGVGEVEDRVRCDETPERAAQRGLVPVVLGGPQRIERGSVAGMDVDHPLTAPAHSPWHEWTAAVWAPVIP